MPTERSALLKDALEKNKVVVERQVFEGVGHNLHQEKTDDVNAAMKGWFKKRGVLAP